MKDYDMMEYYIMYSVNPNEYSNIDISELPLNSRLLRGLRRNGYDTLDIILNAKRKEIQELNGIGQKQIEILENCIETYLGICKESFFEHRRDSDFFKIILSYKPQIINGDFRFKHRLSFEVRDLIENYEFTFNILGKELISDLNENIVKYKRLSKLIYNISKPYLLYNNSIESALECLELVPLQFRCKPAYSFILSTLSEEESRVLLKIADMKIVKLSSLVYYLTMTMKKEIDLVAKVYVKCNYDIKKEIENVVNELYKSEMQKIVLDMRSKGFTLDQIGQQYHKTRERIRQIEARARRYFEHWNAHSKILFFISAVLNSKEVLSSYDVLSVLGEYGEEILYLLKVSEQKYYSYISEVDCFILCDKSKLDEAISLVQDFPDLINDYFVDNVLSNELGSNGIDKDIFMLAIRLVYKKSGKVYHKTALNSSKIYLYIIQKYYPDGIFLYDDTVMTEFKNQIREEFGEVAIPTNNRAIRARITDNCIMCGKGNYMMKKDSYMPEELLSNIISHIENEEHSIIMLNSVYSIFEDHLLLNGIDNRYFLQGILKEELSDKYSFTRDYIFKDSNIGSFYQEIVKYIKKFDYPITKKQIVDDFPGITEIVLSFSVSDENIINYFGEYIHGSKLNLNDTEIEYLYNCVKKTVKDGAVHHSKELYDLVLHDNPNLLKKAGIFYAYSLFSVVEYLFRNEFQLSRPYIAMNDVEFLKPMEIIAEWVRSQALINIKDITLYAKELKYQVYSILDMMNSYNDSHLLISAESIASFEYIGITQEIAEKVETIVTSGISGTELISSLSCINSLPKLNIPWTEWLIYSVLLKWGKNTDLSVTNKYFYYAHPVVALKGKLDISDVNIDEISTTGNSVFIIDDLDNIDDLIADAIDDELFEELI